MTRGEAYSGDLVFRRKIQQSGARASKKQNHTFLDTAAT
jgi:hypothetical protein